MVWDLKSPTEIRVEFDVIFLYKTFNGIIYFPQFMF